MMLEQSAIACAKFTLGSEYERGCVDTIMMAAEEAKRELLDAMEKNGLNKNRYVFKIKMKAISIDTWCLRKD